MSAPIGVRHRGDVDGLRAVAVSVVVAFHASLPGFDGGFVGVDVFFVVSGYLIMGLLLRELDTTDQISLRAFWARRIRRLAPALTVVVVATLVGSVALLSALRWRDVSIESLWASLYVSNIGFGLRSDGYFAAGAAPSPLLHTWSLAVEEQFYLVWPLAVLLLARLAGAVRRSRTAVLLAAVVAAGLASFALGVLLTERGTPWAYYSLPSRWWELGVGIGCAIVWQRRVVGAAAAWALSLGGTALLVASLLLIGDTTPFPGTAALLPVFGTALLLVGGMGSSTPVQRVLSLAPMQLIGRWSYSWYLWHWPVLVLAEAARWATTPGSKAVAALVSIVPAAATHYLVERPVRFNRRLSSSPRWSVLLSVACVVVVGAIAAGVVAWGAREVEDPLLRRLDRAVANRVEGTGDDTSCFVDGRSEPDACGPGSGAVLLIGDSHASHWLPALHAVSSDLGVPVAARTRGGCPAWNVTVAQNGTAESSAACETFRRATVEEIRRLRPSAILLASASYRGRLLDGGELVGGRSEEDAVWTEAVRSALADLVSEDVSVGVILDNPVVPFDPIQCLATEREAGACEFDRDRGFDEVGSERGIERREAERVGAAVFDGAEGICDGARCSTLVGDLVVYSDHSHLTPAFTTSRSEQLASFVAGLTGG